MRGIEKLNPNFQPLVREFERRCNERGLNLKITETLRTTEEQDSLYAMGRSKPGRIVTNAKGSTKSSYHQWGIAFDFCKNQRGTEYSYGKEELKLIGSIGKELGLTWGGDFKKIYDPWHFQLDDKGSIRIADLKAGRLPRFPKIPVQVDEEFNRKLTLLKIKGYIASPEYWSLNANPNKNCKGSYVRGLVEGLTKETFGTGLKKLVSNGIISSPDYWINNINSECSGSYVKILIMNFCRKYNI